MVILLGLPSVSKEKENVKEEDMIDRADLYLPEIQEITEQDTEEKNIQDIEDLAHQTIPMRDICEIEEAEEAKAIP